MENPKLPKQLSEASVLDEFTATGNIYVDPAYASSETTPATSPLTSEALTAANTLSDFTANGNASPSVNPEDTHAIFVTNLRRGTDRTLGGNNFIFSYNRSMVLGDIYISNAVGGDFSASPRVAGNYTADSDGTLNVYIEGSTFGGNLMSFGSMNSATQSFTGNYEFTFKNSVAQWFIITYGTEWSLDANSADYNRFGTLVGNIDILVDGSTITNHGAVIRGGILPGAGDEKAYLRAYITNSLFQGEFGIIQNGDESGSDKYQSNVDVDITVEGSTFTNVFLMFPNASTNTQVRDGKLTITGDVNFKATDTSFTGLNMGAGLGGTGWNRTGWIKGDIKFNIDKSTNASRTFVHKGFIGDSSKPQVVEGTLSNSVFGDFTVYDTRENNYIYADTTIRIVESRIGNFTFYNTNNSGGYVSATANRVFGAQTLEVTGVSAGNMAGNGPAAEQSGASFNLVVHASDTVSVVGDITNWNTMTVDAGAKVIANSISMFGESSTLNLAATSRLTTANIANVGRLSVTGRLFGDVILVDGLSYLDEFTFGSILINGEEYSYGEEIGHYSFADGCLVVHSSPDFELDISELAPGNEEAIEDFKNVSWLGADITLMVSDAQAEGTYKLATAAEGFNKTISVENKLDESLGVLSLDEALFVGDNAYRLDLSDGVLSVIVFAATSNQVIGSGETVTVGLNEASNNAAIVSGGNMIVSTGGIAGNTTVSSGGSMAVSTGGLADNTTVSSGGVFSIEDGGVASHVSVFDGGQATVSSGGLLVKGYFEGGTGHKMVDIRTGGVLSGAEVVGGVDVNVYGAAYDVLLRDGTSDRSDLVVQNNAYAQNVDVRYNGWTRIYANGTLKDLSVSSGGSATLEGGKLTGQMTFMSGAYVTVDAGSIIDFDISEVAPYRAPRLNNLSLISSWSNANFTLTVSNTMGTGSYALADGAAGFNKTITVRSTLGESLGTLEVGEAITINGYEFTLTLSDGSLSLKRTYDLIVSDLILTNSSATVGENELYRNTTILSGGQMDVSALGEAEGVTVSSGGCLWVSSGGMANGTTVNDGGNMTVSSGGVASDVNVSGGRAIVSNGGNLIGAALERNGQLEIARGGVATDVVTNQGRITVHSGGTASDVIINNGSVDIEQGAEVYDLTAYGNYENNLGWIDTWGKVIGTTLDSGSIMEIYGNGSACDTTVNESGFIIVKENGVADSAVINSGGGIACRGAASNIIVSSGGGVSLNLVSMDTYFQGTILGTPCEIKNGVATDFTVNTGGGLYLEFKNAKASNTVVNGDFQVIAGKAIDTTINSGGIMTLQEVGEADGIIVKSGGALDIQLYPWEGEASNVTVSSGGRIWMENGAKATVIDITGAKLDVKGIAVLKKVTVHSGASVLIASGGTATDIAEDGGWIDYADGAALSFASNTFSGLTLNNGQSATVHSGTTATSTTVTSGGMLKIFSSGIADGVAVRNGGMLLIDRGGSVTGMDFRGGGTLDLTVDSGTNIAGTSAGSVIGFESGSAATFDVTPQTKLTLRDGGVVSEATVNYGGQLDVFSGGVVSSAIVNIGSLNISSGGTVSDAVVNVGGGQLNVSGGGTLSRATVNEYGNMTMESGAVVSNAVVSSGGSLYVSGGVSATGIRIEDGGRMELTVDRDTDVAWTYGDGAENRAQGSISDCVFSGGRLTLDRTYATDLTLDCARFDVIGGTVCNLSGYNQYVWEQTFYNFRSGSVLTGRIEGEILYINLSGDSILNFDISAIAPDKDTTRLNIGGSINWYDDDMMTYPTMANQTMTVSEAQMEGRYILAKMGNLFCNAPILARDTAGNELEELTLDYNEFELAGKTYTLSQTDSGDFVLDVRTVAESVIITVTGDTTTPLQSSTVTATVAAGSELFISTDNAEWIEYQSGTTLTVGENATYFFKALDGAGNIGTNWIKFENIDTTAPDAPTVSADITTLTNTDVTLTATFSEDSVKKQYRIGEGEWTAYEGPVTMTENGTVFFRGFDPADNESAETSHTVDYIDKTPPDVPTFAADITALTNTDVVVTATFSEDSVVREYRIDEGEWIVYEGPVTMTKNGTVTFRGTDAATNTAESVYEVTNIDKESPVITLVGDNRTPLQAVTLSAYTEEGLVIEVSTDNENWTEYTGEINVPANVTTKYYFRATDAARNTGTNEIEFSNVDTIAPDAPTVSADITTLTNRDLKVTAVFSDDSTRKEYRIGEGEWTAYEGPVTMTENGTVAFRGTDAAGNESEVVPYPVDCIDKTPPEAPTFVADITDPTNTDVVVTATFSDDSVVREYRIDDGAWTVYTEPVTITQNGAVTFRGTDAAGNIAEAVCPIDNINKVAPIITLEGDNINPRPSATLSASTEPGLVIEISTDEVNWTEYTGEIAIPANIKYYFRATDAAGNTGKNEIEFANIDSEVPVIAEATLTQGADNYVFTVSQTVTDNVVPAEQLAYSVRYAASTDALASARPVEGLSFTLTEADAAKTFYYQTSAQDTAGNITWTDPEAFTVADRTAPVLAGQPEASFADRKVSITWDPATDNVDVAGYRLTLNDVVYDLREPDFVLEGVAAGDYIYQVTAYDAAGNETASEQKTLTVEPRADLHLRSVRVRTKKDDGTLNTTTTISITDDAELVIVVGNMGDIASADSTAYVWFGNFRLPISVASVEAGSEQSIVYPVKGNISTGIQDIRVVLDEDGKITEYDESNNERSLTLNVENTLYGDLVIGSVRLDRTVCSGSENATLTFTVRNIGYDDIAASKAFIYDGERKIAEVAVSALEMGGETQALTCEINAAMLVSAGSHVIRIVANAGDNPVQETNLKNNSAQTQLTVGFCDLSISRLAVSQDVIDTESSVTVNFTVRNSGTDTVAPSLVGIYDGETKLGTVELDELSGGLSVSRQFVIEAGTLAAGSHDLRIVADDGQTVIESDKANNARSISLDVTQKDDSAPMLDDESITIIQNADGYEFAVSAFALDNLTPASKLVYGVRYAETEEGLETAKIAEGKAFSLTPEQAGKTLYYQVSATDLNGNTVWSGVHTFTAEDHTAPEIGDILVSTENSVLGLNWTATDNVGVVSYNIYLDGALVSTQETASFTKEDITVGDHTFRIEAVDAAGNISTTGTMNVNVGDTIKPVIGSVGAMQSADGYGIAFAVTASDNNTQASALVLHTQYAFSEEDVQNAPLSSLNIMLTPEDAGKTLFYRVSATDEAGNTAWSGIQSLVVSDMTAPDTPTELTGTVNGSDVTLNWTASSDNVGVTGYQVRIASSEVFEENVFTVADNSHMLTALPEGVYYWQTAAVDATGNVSEWSAVESFRILPKDVFGTNDTAEQAFELGSLSNEQFWPEGSITSADDVDWFKFTLDTKGTANDSIRIVFDGSLGELEFSLYSADGAVLLRTADVTEDDVKTIALDGLQKGTYLLKVNGKDGAMNTFSLFSKKVAGYDADIYDANERNDSMGTATIFDVENEPQATISGLNIESAADVDLYQFTLANMGLEGDSVSISFEDSVGDLDLALFDSKGLKVAESAGTGNVETVSFSGLAAGIYYIQVSASDSKPNEYTLNWNFTPDNVEADWMEVMGQPYEFTGSEELSGLSISTAGDGVTQEDTFLLTLDQPGSASSRIRFSNYRSDWNGLKYVVKDGNDTVVLSGTGAEISLDGLAAGNYTLTVDTPVSGSFGSYDISVSLPETAATKWTYMVYMAADNDLDKYALYDLISMQQANLDSQIDIYVLVDRNPTTLSDLLMLGSKYRWDSLWSDTRVGKISYSPRTNVSVEWESWGELETSSVETLERFVTWVQEQSKAENYGLIMWDHGAENGSLCYDLTTDASWGTSLTVSDVSGLLTEKGNIPLVVFNNCLLGSEIVATQMAGSTDVIVVSEAESYPLNTTYAYKEFFSTITADMTAQQMAEVLVQNVQQANSTSPSMLSAIDVTDSRLSSALENLATAVSSANNSKDLSVLVNSLLKAQQDGCAYTGSSMYQSDLYDMIVQAMANRQYSGTSEQFKTALAELKSVLEQIVLSSKTVPSNKGYGIAVFNPVLTAQSFTSPFTSSRKVAEAIQNYLNTVYASNPAWAGLLSDLLAAYQAQPYAYSTQSASFSVSSIIDFGNNELVSCVELGCFSGHGVVLDGISLIGDLYFSVSITDENKATGGFNVTNNADAAVTVSVLSDTGELVATGTNGAVFENLPVGDYYILLQSDTDCAVTLSFEADWMTGVDRFDYARSKTNEKNVNGNDSIDKATALAAGYYSGLLTYQGDSDWYRIGNVNVEKYKVLLNGAEGLSVAEYDTAGTLVQTAVYSDGTYTMTMKSMNYLVVEGFADITLDQVNAYSVFVSSASGEVVDDIPPVITLAGDNTTPLRSSILTAGTEDGIDIFYSTDNVNWIKYEGEIEVTSNGTYYFKATDEAGNTGTNSLVFENIDREAPTAPVASAENAATEGNILVTATFSDDSVKKEYSRDKENWMEYTSAVLLAANEVVYFRGTDAAGNESKVTTYRKPVNAPDNGDDDFLSKNGKWNEAYIKVSNTISGIGEINLDEEGTIDDGKGKHNMFGNDGTNKDAGDVAKVSVENTAKLTFSISSTAAGTFYVYEKVDKGNGKYKQVTVGKVAVKANSATPPLSVSLADDGSYFVAMIAKSTKKGSAGYYNVNVTGYDASVYEDADDGGNDTWSKATPIEIGRNTNALFLDSDESNFVGFSDPKDYAKLELESSAYMSFDLTSDGKVKFTLWKQKIGSTANPTKVTSKSLPSKGAYTGVTAAKFLDTSKYVYYISMESTDAAKGGAEHYNVSVNSAVFFDPDGDKVNKYVYSNKKLNAQIDQFCKNDIVVSTDPQEIFLDSNEINQEGYSNFVGYNDKTDYAKLSVAADGEITFAINTTGAGTFTVWRNNASKKKLEALGKVEIKADQKTGTLTVSGLKSGEEYFISMTAKSTKANASGSVFYKVMANATLSGSNSSVLAMPETDSLGISDALSFGQYDADALAGASASALADLDDKSAWLNIASLA